MEGVDWQTLERLRAVFLEGAPVRGAYWKSRADLASYDATLGERIGWKWDAVLGELQRLGWTPPPGPLLDFGCGSGIAGRRVLSALARGGCSELRLNDKSPLAEEFAAEKARTLFPDLPLRIIPGGNVEAAAEGATVVISHVLGELPEAGRERLRECVRRAAAVLWVEPGTHADSHALIDMREALLAEFRPVAPCTHGSACGLRTPGNERHWCHFFGRPPWEIFADPEWAAFADRMGIDLRSLPFSYLILDRRDRAANPKGPVEGCTRVLGTPRFYKGYARLFGCRDDGVTEFTWAKRHAGPLFKRVKNEEAGSLFRLETEEAEIQSLEPVPPLPPEESETTGD